MPQIVMRLVEHVRVDVQRLVRARHRLVQRPGPIDAVQRVGFAMNDEKRHVDCGHACLDGCDGVQALGTPAHRRAVGEHRVGLVSLEVGGVARQVRMVDAKAHPQPRRHVREHARHRDLGATAHAYRLERGAADDGAREAVGPLRQVVQRHERAHAVPVEHHRSSGLLGGDASKLGIQVAPVLRPPVDVNARAGRAPVTAVVVAVDRVARLDHRRDDVTVAPAVLAHPVHERDDRLGLAVGNPLLRPQLETIGPGQAPLGLPHVCPSHVRRGQRRESPPRLPLPAGLRAGATLPTNRRRPG